MHVGPAYFKDFKGVPGLAGQFGQKPEEPKPAPDLVHQILAWVPKQLTVGDVKGLVQDARQAARALRRPPPAVIGRLRILTGIVAQARSQGTDAALLTERATSSIIHAIGRVWQALDVAAKQSGASVQIVATRAILLNAQRRFGAPDPGSAIAPEPTAMTDAVNEAESRELAETGEKKSGLPVWAWVLIGTGTVGIIAAILYLLFRQKTQMNDADDSPLEPLPAPAGTKGAA